MVIGGAEIYAQAMPRATRLEITQIHASPEGDTRFPAIDGGWDGSRPGEPIRRVRTTMRPMIS